MNAQRDKDSLCKPGVYKVDVASSKLGLLGLGHRHTFEGAVVLHKKLAALVAAKVAACALVGLLARAPDKIGAMLTKRWFG